MLSQLLFGECFEVLEKTEKWVKIRSHYDKYEGWIDSKQYQGLTEDEYSGCISPKVLNCGVDYKLIKQSTKEILHLPAGSSIPAKSGSADFKIGEESYSFLDEPNFNNTVDFGESIEKYASFFLQAPYLWGGRTLFGIDCSGFTQIVFKMLNIQINRDAWQQAEQGTVVDFLQEVKPGDLAFFDNDEGRIVHVGIMLNENQIIHASGRVKVDPIDDQGIYSLDLKKHTHKLRIIKRYV